MSALKIDGRLPGLNELINACRTGWQAGAKLKRESQDYVNYFIIKSKKIGMLKPMKGQVRIYITYCEANKKRDLDNVESAAKYILDALVESGIIENDSPKYLTDLQQRVIYGKEPYILVEIEKGG